MPTTTVNGAELFHDVRGAGPPLLLIMGATGDGGHFDRLAELLADGYTVVRYDRRGNGRSSRPPGWVTTSPEEQADDAAALLSALELTPAAVFGTSSGANFALALVVRHPATVRAALLHEPVMISLTDDPAAVRRAGASLFTEAGPPAETLERFWRLVGGAGSWDQLDSSLRERMLASARTFFEIEAGTFEDYLPDNDTLAAITVPLVIMISDNGRRSSHEAANRLAQRLGLNVMRTSGSHTPYHDHPHELAEVMRSFLSHVHRTTA
jgi:pimeloyl-ACP methyl ester carboxylesterase